MTGVTIGGHSRSGLKTSSAAARLVDKLEKGSLSWRAASEHGGRGPEFVAWGGHGETESRGVYVFRSQGETVIWRDTPSADWQLQLDRESVERAWKGEGAPRVVFRTGHVQRPYVFEAPSFTAAIFRAGMSVAFAALIAGIALLLLVNVGAGLACFAFMFAVVALVNYMSYRVGGFYWLSPSMASRLFVGSLFLVAVALVAAFA